MHLHDILNEMGFALEAANPVFVRQSVEDMGLPSPLYRLDSKTGERYYYRIVDGDPVYYVSVTTWIGAVLKQQALENWRANVGGAEAEAVGSIAAHYGTMFHIEAARALSEGEYNLDQAAFVVRAYADEHHLAREKTAGWVDRLQAGIISWMKFLADYDVRPLAVEIMLADGQGRAGALDAVVEMRAQREDGKPDPRRTVRAIIDVKTGKAFHDSHVLQLHCYRRMWQENFPEMEIHRVLNWRPGEWSTRPDYVLTDQTGHNARLMLDPLWQVYQVWYGGRKPDWSVREIRGTIKKGDDVRRFVQVRSIDDVLREYHNPNPLQL